MTISAGGQHQKIFDSADKIFELSNANPIGVMVYNGMSFAEAPLPSLIRAFRDQSKKVHKVEDAAEQLLDFLNDFGKKSPRPVLDNNLLLLALPIIKKISNKVASKLQTKITEAKDLNIDFAKLLSDLLNDEIGFYEAIIADQGEAHFVGGGSIRFSASHTKLLKQVVDKEINYADEKQKKRIVSLIKNAMKKDSLSQNYTGIVVAGFGAKEIFPTLISFEIDGVLCDKLKYLKTNSIDVDREVDKGPKAKVLPFAQKEMAERFLFGLDKIIQDRIHQFCEETIPNIRQEMLNKLDLKNGDGRDILDQMGAEAEKAFLNGLKTEAFEKIRSLSQSAIEDMVEFMPKPEIAKMAEALVNLTSIKRRVSRGMETVGGPIDVALISQAEGFVWIKRKHYFPANLNARYFARVGSGMAGNEEARNEEN